MPFFNTFLGLVSLLLFLVVHTLAQSPGDATETEITLWQFSTGRLLSGQQTLPLQPLRTAEDGLATAYLYRVLNPVTVATVVDASRTVIASPSGWVEPFDKNVSIACGLVNATFGECLNINGTNTVAANHGAPTPQIFRVAAADLADSTADLADSTSSPSLTSTFQSNAKHRPSAAVVAGAVLGSLVLLLVLGLCIALLIRRRRQQFEHTFAARGYDPESGNNSNVAGNHLPFAVFAAGPQVELALPAKGHKRDESWGRQSERTSELPTSDLVRIPVQRVQDEREGAEAPPAYPATPRFPDVPRLPLGAEVSNISVEDISANSNNEQKSLTEVGDLVSWNVLPPGLYRSISLNSLSQMRPSVNRN
ncbi:hypothetical protein DFH08DRAFT_806160 [Mycena albidolilacea]|uniref:Epidermal growth factor receptor-like transmembrane-juxtamembrane segment domain-containing protein n=1 Tax=Mycena albidolilacea TaxID=1033008 RepID=A0AAD7A7R9_9AGAR|nr:hypothetical protein DFH08DRAFT_806160 [Mycena albidolilacea]